MLSTTETCDMQVYKVFNLKSIKEKKINLSLLKNNNKRNELINK